MSEFPKEDFQLDLALVEETLQEYLRTGDIHSDNVALLFPTTPRVYKGGIYTEDNTYKACLLYTSPSPRDLSTSRMPSSA